jgi:hypothetical protein
LGQDGAEERVVREIEREESSRIEEMGRDGLRGVVVLSCSSLFVPAEIEVQLAINNGDLEEHTKGGEEGEDGVGEIKVVGWNQGLQWILLGGRWKLQEKGI